MGSTNFFYRRDLPHWQPSGGMFFVTFRQAGCLPLAVQRRLAERHRRRMNAPAREHESERERAYRFSELAFAAYDRALDHPSCVPGWMRDPAIATLVAEALLAGHRSAYDLLRWVVMPNHVHALLRPLTGDQEALGHRRPLALILHRIKGRTARAANLALGRSGSFWQQESYDHWVRDEHEFTRIAAYIDRNPVLARLCSSAEDWRWSSAGWNR